MAKTHVFSSISARIKPALHEQIIEEADARGVSARVVISDALEEHFNKAQTKKLRTVAATNGTPNATDAATPPEHPNTEATG